MKQHLTRRGFMSGAAGALLGLEAARVGRLDREGRASGKPASSFDFMLLGDLHLDQLEHHDMEWLQREKPNDVRQVRNYSRITREVMPRLFAEVREQIAGNPRVALTAQIGDFVEGLCGTPELACQHCADALRFVRSADLGSPFLITKGNHDITGPGAVEAYNEVLLPFIGEQAGKKLRSASFVHRHGNALFAYYDAYSPDSLSWLEEVLAQRTEQHLFVLVHPPVVPYGARSTWHLYARPNQAPQRQRLLRLLGRHRALVLTGHIHKYSTLVRETAEGPFLQLAVNSIIPSPDVAARDEVSGVENFTPDQVRLEPQFSPDTEAERRASLAAEAPFIRRFEYANAPGYAVIQVRGADVIADLYLGLGRHRWRTRRLSDLLSPRKREGSETAKPK